MSRAAYVGGILLLAVCVFTSLVLALEHIGGLHLPGCGEGSPCAEAAASVWGKVPYLNWPVSFLGLAYFLGLTVWWLTARRGVPAGMRYLVRCGAVISLGFVVVMVVEGHLCSHCLATHLANFGLWIVVERMARAAGGSARALASVLAAFVISSGVLGATEWRERRAAQAEAEEELASSTEAMIAATSQRAGAPEEVVDPVTVAVESIAEATAPAAPAAEMREPAAATRSAQASAGFTGRHRLGPEKAAIRVVMFSDFQCKECRRIDLEIVRLFEQRDDMSVSFKHFPWNPDCNRLAVRRAHPNACWAARAAETAAILRGNGGFWEMHSWLFRRGGSFTQTELRGGLRGFGYEIGEFERIMQSDETLERVQADVEDAISVGVYQTPTIFINGVELRGWEARNAVRRAVEQLAATNPEPMTAAHDHPPGAVEKLIGDWRAQPRRPAAATTGSRSLGPETARVHVVIFSDYQHSGTTETDAVVRRAVEQRGDVRYDYRHFPFNRDCNPAVNKETKYPQACWAARAAEAAANLAGTEGFWKMHVWLLENQERFNDAALREAADEMGIDAAALLAEMAKPETQAAVVEDAKRGRRLGATKVPTVFINGRMVPRWKLEAEDILPHIIAAAAGE